MGCVLGRPRAMGLSLPLLLLLLWQQPPVEATVYTHSRDGSLHTAYHSVEAHFGAPFQRGTLYQAQLRYLADNPHLCSDDSVTRHGQQHVVYKKLHTPTRGGANNTSTDKNNSASLVVEESPPQLPIAFLVAGGLCSMEQKVRVAESLAGDNVVGFFLVYPDHSEHPVWQSHEMVPADTAIRIAAVSRRTEQDLMLYLYEFQHEQQQQPQPHVLTNSSSAAATETAVGGPWVTITTAEKTTKHHAAAPSASGLFGSLDSGATTATDDGIYGLTPNEGEAADLVDPDLGLVFVMMIFSAFLFVFAAIAQHRDSNRLRPRTDFAAPAENEYMGRNLITPEDVERYLVVVSTQRCSEVVPRERNGKGEGTTPCGCVGETDDSILPLHCAICIEDFGDDEPNDDNDEGQQGLSTIRLPCNHTFHADCILPWLTERQGTCPLCKYDVFQFVQEASAIDFSLPPPLANAISRTRRRLWFLSPLLAWMGDTNNTEDSEDGDDDAAGQESRHGIEITDTGARRSGFFSTATEENSTSLRMV